MKECGAIILAAGSGSRMKSNTPKQFMMLNGLPLFLHSVRVFAECVDEIVLVTGKESIAYCYSVLDAEKFEIPVHVIEGGKERYHSSMAGLAIADEWEYVMIHDAARACITKDVIENSLSCAKEYGSGVAAVPAKDTIKVANQTGAVVSTPNRSTLRVIQTPQCFKTVWIKQAYEKMRTFISSSPAQSIAVTDDAMVLETFGERTVYLSEGSYKNIKVTTPEDLMIAQIFQADVNSKS